MYPALNRRTNIEAAQPDPYENMRTRLSVRSRVWLQIRLMTPKYREPVYMFPSYLDRDKAISHLFLHSSPKCLSNILVVLASFLNWFYASSATTSAGHLPVFCSLWLYSMSVRSRVRKVFYTCLEKGVWKQKYWKSR